MLVSFVIVHDDVIKWKLFPRYWPFVRGIHRSPVNSPHKGQWRGALMFTLICVWINGWVNNHEAGDLRRYRVHYGVIVMVTHRSHEKGPLLSRWHFQFMVRLCNHCILVMVSRKFFPGALLTMCRCCADTCSQQNRKQTIMCNNDAMIWCFTRLGKYTWHKPSGDDSQWNF